MRRSRIPDDSRITVSLIENFIHATGHGVSPTSIVTDYIRLFGGHGKPSVQEYFYYRMWEPEKTKAEKKQFIGKTRAGVWHRCCTSPGWLGIANDKLICHAVMQTANLPIPTIRAVYHPTRKYQPTYGRPPVANIHTPEGLKQYLDKPNTGSLFAKPVNGTGGRGTIKIDHDPDTGTTKTTSHEILNDPVEDVISKSPRGYIIQDVLHTHNEMKPVFGNHLCSLRITIFLGNEPFIASVALKIKTGENIADNYRIGGNFLGAVDKTTGQIIRVISGSGKNLETHMIHPETQASMTGFQIPDWNRIIETVKMAAYQFPGIKTQSWDVAITDNGPILIEINPGGDLNLHQLSHNRGFITPEYIEHLKRNNVRI